jgi:transposase
VARAAGIHTSQLYRWRRNLCDRLGPASRFAAVAIAPAAVAVASAAAVGMIEIEFGRGARVRITGAVDAATVSAAITALTTRARS